MNLFVGCSNEKVFGIKQLLHKAAAVYIENELLDMVAFESLAKYEITS